MEMRNILYKHYSRVTSDDAAQSPSRWALAPLSHLYGFGMYARARLYAGGLLQQRALPVKVISIGNLSVGGTGKTPVVIAVANALRGKGRRVGVASRGYGRRAVQDVLEVSNGRSRVSNPAQTGDEPLLIAERCPDVPVAVGADRYAAGRYLLDRFGIDTLVLDDGFQHLALKRDVDVVLLDATAALGNNFLLPRGRLRERLSALERASVILVTRAGQAEDLGGVLKAIRRVAPALPLCITTFNATALQKIGTPESQPPDVLKGERVVALSGIGNPDSFRHLLESLGAVVVDHCLFPDHHPYSVQDVRVVTQVAANLRADRVVTTEKDAVKLQLLADSSGQAAMWVVRIELAWLESWKEWERLVLQN
jgi:tetraacyldisaccharide 4'-kinase